jgi:hypothetical protein
MNASVKNGEICSETTLNEICFAYIVSFGVKSCSQFSQKDRVKGQFPHRRFRLWVKSNLPLFISKSWKRTKMFSTAKHVKRILLVMFSDSPSIVKLFSCLFFKSVLNASQVKRFSESLNVSKIKDYPEIASLFSCRMRIWWWRTRE